MLWFLGTYRRLPLFVSSMRHQHPLHQVHHVIHQPALLGLWSGKPEDVAARRQLPADDQTLRQGQLPPWSRWTGRRGRKIFLATVGLDQGLLGGGPLGGEALAAGLGQDVLDQLDKTAAQGRGEVVEADFGQAGGGGELAVKRFDLGGAGAVAGAFLAGCVGVESGGGEGGDVDLVQTVHQDAVPMLTIGQK